jgi:predicted esterase
MTQSLQIGFKLFFLLTAVFLFMPFVPVHANETDNVRKQTFVYAVKEMDTLRLDKYDMPADGSKPCLIFVFGGSFSKGARDNITYLSFYRTLASNGYKVVAIDYRLGMKNFTEKLDKSSDSVEANIVRLFESSINMAVEDLFDATSYIVANADVWGVDTSQIISCGSSAGAVTVLQGEYERCNTGKSATHLPNGFSYAGIIAFAGAVFSSTGELKWNTKPAPIQLFHGDADKEVPYDKITFRQYGFYGSSAIAAQLKAMGASCYFYSMENTGHEVSNLPMQQNWDEIHTFLQKFVAGKENLTIDVSVVPMDKSEVDKELTFEKFMSKFR